jgi:hypothetical protein
MYWKFPALESFPVFGRSLLTKGKSLQESRFVRTELARLKGRPYADIVSACGRPERDARFRPQDSTKKYHPECRLLDGA